MWKAAIILANPNKHIYILETRRMYLRIGIRVCAYWLQYSDLPVQQTIKSDTVGLNPGSSRRIYRTLAGIIILSMNVDIWRAWGISLLLEPRFFIGSASCMPMCVPSWHGEYPDAPSRVHSNMFMCSAPTLFPINCSWLQKVNLRVSSKDSRRIVVRLRLRIKGACYISLNRWRCVVKSNS